MTLRVGSLTLVWMVLLAGLLCAAPAAAQGRGTAGAQERRPLIDAIGVTNPDPLPPGGPTPRMADGRPDLAGVWYSGVIGRPSAWSRTPRPQPKEDPVPFRPEARARIDRMTPTERQLLSPAINCMPRGVPGLFVSNPYPFQLMTFPGVFIQLVEDQRDWRLVHTDRRPHPTDPDPLFNGNSSAWWDGDTLTIDSIGFDERTWIMNTGWYHSDQLRLIERIRRPSMNYLEYQFTVEDPKVLTASWTSAWRQYTLSQIDDELQENYCTNNQNPGQLRKLYELETQTGNR
ncbi:MAG: hypothetical protein A3I61_08055 [Acidobacteria bacterium RIFCSPLOWO2_02_FULL_68_18]|nr:MAG: hypothetical protein A3I61_08055 [Acidobacteria bacterium RIFCSPLOWO2_02_FULL_68_18]OFW51195.1 MAG: hypothetical protein A3G77_06155 [Acidobacteria bacterium RIFCSPLOWO2_12_FULL_68_19]